MGTIKILFFATFKDRTGLSQAEFEFPENASVAELKAHLVRQYPALNNLINHALVAVNQNYAFDEDLVPVGAEVALFPPVSGGSEANPEYPTFYEITRDPIDLDELVARITLPTTGAACVFSGMVRGITQRGDPHETVSLEYEAYIPMAETKMSQVAMEIRARWPAVEGIVIVQRIGLLGPGTPTVLIACTAAHRDTGVFEAARYGIDRLKEIVPVWKKEIGPGGEEWVEGEYLPRRGD
jgi:molybdopterin synthase catalytic subunit